MSGHTAELSGAGSNKADKYGGLRPKNPLLNKTNHGAYFDSADYQLKTISGARTGSTPSQLKPAYPTATQGGSPRKAPGRTPSNLGQRTGGGEPKSNE